MYHLWKCEEVRLWTIKKKDVLGVIMIVQPVQAEILVNFLHKDKNWWMNFMKIKLIDDIWIEYDMMPMYARFWVMILLYLACVLIPIGVMGDAQGFHIGFFVYVLIGLWRITHVMRYHDLR